MYRFSRSWLAAAALFVPMLAWAQPQGAEVPRPRLDIVNPFGAKLGTSLEVQISGADLEETTELRFNHPGIKAELIELPEPKANPKEPKKTKLGKASRASGKFKITVDASVKPGIYEVRSINRFGISNPRVFIVSDLNEVAEKEPNNDVPQAQKIELNTIVNGSFSSPTDVDYYQITAKKGQRILASCATGTIDSSARPLVEIYSKEGRLLTANRNYSGDDALADLTIPADGDYLIRVCEFTYTFSANVPAISYFYRLTVSTNPWIDAVHPPMVQPGKPTQVTVYGRNLPGGKKSSAYKIQGKEIEELTVTITPPGEASKLNVGFRIDPRSAELDAFAYSIPSPTGSSNVVPIFFARDPVVLEKEPNDTPESAQEIPINSELAGRIEKRNDTDWYTFTAKKGQSLWIELYADRLNCTSTGVSTLMYFSLKKADPKSGNITEQEDSNDTLSPNHFFTRNGDPPAFKFIPPEDGKYLIQVGSRESSTLYGPKAQYRLCISDEKPDFRVVAITPYTQNALPSSINLEKGAPASLDIYVFRKQGFHDPILLTAEGLPPGVECPPQIIGTNQIYGALVLTAKPDAAEYNGPIRIVASANVRGVMLKREVRPASITWPGPQNNPNFPLIGRLDQECCIAVRDKPLFQIKIDPNKIFIKKEEKLPLPLVLKPGDKLTVPLEVVRNAPEAKVAITTALVTSQRNNQGLPGNQPPLLFNNGQPMPTIAADKNDTTFGLEVRATAQPGVYPVVVKAFGQIPYDKNPDGKNKKPAIFTAVSTPFTVKVLPATLGKFTSKAPANAKPGDTVDVAVKVTRENDYTGEYKLKLTLPADLKGAEVKEVVLPAGKDEVMVPIKLAKEVTPKNYQGIVLSAVGKYENQFDVKSEIKFDMAIVKGK